LGPEKTLYVPAGLPRSRWGGKKGFKKNHQTKHQLSGQHKLGQKTEGVNKVSKSQREKMGGDWNGQQQEVGSEDSNRPAQDNQVIVDKNRFYRDATKGKRTSNLTVRGVGKKSQVCMHLQHEKKTIGRAA